MQRAPPVGLGLADGTATVGINLRCVEGIDVDTLSPRPWDGRSL